jgi:hypothetical protein
MKGDGGGLEFDAAIGGDGKIEVPGSVLHRLGVRAGSRVHVRLIPAVIAEALKQNNVSYEEVERIASVQLESPEQVIAFLLAEGALAHGGRARRRTIIRTKGRTK